MPFAVQAPAGFRPLLPSVALERLAIEVRLGDEGRIEALRRNPHGCGQIGNRCPLVSESPKGFSGGRKRNIAVESTRSPTPAGR
ncbi:hypothetical protein D3C87_1741510 [compost metagenome]